VVFHAINHNFFSQRKDIADIDTMPACFQPTPGLSPDSEKEPQVEEMSSNETLVAVCGVAIRAPGGIKNAADYWDLIINGRDARGPTPPSRYNIDGFDGSLGGRGSIKTRFGYFLEDDLSKIDTSFFSMSRKEVERCDPQQRLLLEVTREALENAGEIDYRGKRVACFIGTFGDDWAQLAGKETLHPRGGLGYVTTGHGDLMLSNRVSYEYDLKGPRQVVSCQECEMRSYTIS
jgi:acyl transferase domain-containing protein